jgi:hypothetical protein
VMFLSRDGNGAESKRWRAKRFLVQRSRLDACK